MPLSNALSREDATEFHFVEGECESTPVEEVTQFYQGPYLSFYPWPPRMQEAEYDDTRERAYELIYEAIEEDGPFDAILGFSQGASLAYSFLQQHATKHPYDPPWSLFRCAVFVCGMPPFRLNETRQPSLHRKPSASLGQAVNAQELSDCLSSLAASKPVLRSEESRDSDSNSPSCSASAGSTFSQQLTSTVSPASAISSVVSLDPNDASFKLESDDFELAFDEDFRALQIPSVHVGGRSDKVYNLTRKLYDGMDRNNALWVEHELGHTIPWDKKNTQTFVEAIRRLERSAVLT